MATVFLSGGLRDAAGGTTEIEVDAANVRQMLVALGEKFPDMKLRLEQGLTIAIDGDVYQDAWFQPIEATSEVYLISAMAGG